MRRSERGNRRSWSGVLRRCYASENGTYRMASTPADYAVSDALIRTSHHEFGYRVGVSDSILAFVVVSFRMLSTVRNACVEIVRHCRGRRSDPTAGAGGACWRRRYVVRLTRDRSKW